MPKKLAVSVHVHDEETGRTTVYQAGASVPAAVAKQISNPDVWETGDEPDDSYAEGTRDPGNSGIGGEGEPVTTDGSGGDDSKPASRRR